LLRLDQKSAAQVWQPVAERLRTCWPKVGICIQEAEHVISRPHGLAHPAPHETARAKSLERPNKRVKQGADILSVVALLCFRSLTRAASCASSVPPCSNTTNKWLF
jgi:hypothetical protein